LLSSSSTPDGRNWRGRHRATFEASLANQTPFHPVYVLRQSPEHPEDILKRNVDDATALALDTHIRAMGGVIQGREESQSAHGRSVEQIRNVEQPLAERQRD
jgi:hypothetical protein